MSECQRDDDFHEVFEEPTSLEDAEQRRKDLTLDIQSIQAQLGDKQRTNENGRRLSHKDYWAWRKKAQFALNQKLDALRSLKAWIKEHRPTINPVIGRQAIEHLGHLVKILEAWEEDDLSELELARLTEAKTFLDRAG